MSKAAIFPIRAKENAVFYSEQQTLAGTKWTELDDKSTTLPDASFLEARLSKVSHITNFEIQHLIDNQAKSIETSLYKAFQILSETTIIPIKLKDLSSFRYIFRKVIMQEQEEFALYHDIVPERTPEDFQKGYQARMSRVKDRLHEYIDIDLPIVEDGEDW